jgi:hypothetical protein
LISFVSVLFIIILFVIAGVLPNLRSQKRSSFPARRKRERSLEKRMAAEMATVPKRKITRTRRSWIKRRTDPPK